MKDKYDVVGTNLVDFTLPTSRQIEFSTASLRDKKKMVIVLLRDIHWPFCRAHVGRLAQRYEEFTALETEIIPILVDNLANAQTMEMKYAKMKFPILYDEKNSVAPRLHQEFKLSKLGRLPGMLIVDKHGTIRYAYYSDSMSDIPKNQDVLEIVHSLSSSWSTPLRSKTVGDRVKVCPH